MQDLRLKTFALLSSGGGVNIEKLRYGATVAILKSSQRAKIKLDGFDPNSYGNRNGFSHDLYYVQRNCDEVNDIDLCAANGTYPKNSLAKFATLTSGKDGYHKETTGGWSVTYDDFRTAIQGDITDVRNFQAAGIRQAIAEAEHRLMLKIEDYLLTQIVADVQNAVHLNGQTGPRQLDFFNVNPNGAGFNFNPQFAWQIDAEHATFGVEEGDKTWILDTNFASMVNNAASYVSGTNNLTGYSQTVPSVLRGAFSDSQLATKLGNPNSANAVCFMSDTYALYSFSHLNGGILSTPSRTVTNVDLARAINLIQLPTIGDAGGVQTQLFNYTTNLYFSGSNSPILVDWLARIEQTCTDGVIEYIFSATPMVHLKLVKTPIAEMYCGLPAGFNGAGWYTGCLPAAPAACTPVVTYTPPTPTCTTVTTAGCSVKLKAGDVLQIAATGATPAPLTFTYTLTTDVELSDAYAASQLATILNVATMGASNGQFFVKGTDGIQYVQSPTVNLAPDGTSITISAVSGCIAPIVLAFANC